MNLVPAWGCLQEVSPIWPQLTIAAGPCYTQAALAWRRDPQRCRDMAVLLSQPSYRAAREVPAYTAWIQYVETVAGQASLSDAVLRPAARENGAWLGGHYFGPNF